MIHRKVEEGQPMDYSGNKTSVLAMPGFYPHARSGLKTARAVEMKDGSVRQGRGNQARAAASPLIKRSRKKGRKLARLAKRLSDKPWQMPAEFPQRGSAVWRPIGMFCIPQGQTTASAAVGTPQFPVVPPRSLSILGPHSAQLVLAPAFQTDGDFVKLEDDHCVLAPRLNHENAMRGQTARVFVNLHNGGGHPAANVAVKVLLPAVTLGFPMLNPVRELAMAADPDTQDRAICRDW
jgi:hypothetical protein